MYLAPEAELLREFLGASDDMIDCPTPAQRELFGPKRRRVPADDGSAESDPARPGAEPGAPHERRRRAPEQFQRADPAAARSRPTRNSASSPAATTGSSPNIKTEDADTVFVSLGCAADNIEAACDYLREQRNAQGRLDPRQRHPPVPRSRRHQSAARQEKRHHPRAHRRRPGRRQSARARHPRRAGQGASKRAKFGGDAAARCTPDETPRLFRGAYGIGSRDFRPEHTLGAYEFAIGQTRAQGRPSASDGETYLRARRRSSVRRHLARTRRRSCREGAIAVRFHSIGGWGMITTGKNLGSIIGDFGTVHLRAEPELRRRRLARREAVRHGQPEIRLGEKRRADELLSHRRARRRSR